MNVSKPDNLNPAGVLGRDLSGAVRRATDFLSEHEPAELLARVGETIDELAVSRSPDRRPLPAAYGGGKPCKDDLLAGLGVFYVTESGKLMLDCTGGHYQMSWGYNHPALVRAVTDALELGIVWDNHSNIPQAPVKQLAAELVALGEGTGLDRVLMGTVTGSVACAAALKIMLARHEADERRAALGPPVILSLHGNYHGTDLAMQTLRGMWPGLVAGMEPIEVEPNDPAGLRAAFESHGRRVAGFWAEPILMNREAIEVAPGFLGLARELCTEHGALMALDEIQTGFWCPDILLSRCYDFAPDLLVVGKGLTAGFHPQAALLYRGELDILEQYDAISTNGNAALAAYLGLCNLRLIRRGRERIASLAEHHFEEWSKLPGEFPDRLEEVNGSGLLTGLKFRDRDDAIRFHRAAVERGLWLRVHAYHPGHRTILTKFALAATEPVIDRAVALIRELLRGA
ncbi:MAG: aminotransferase class III-fold pyridoxal phosphate-dependent enzyme [Planctomycetota bacterium]